MEPLVQWLLAGFVVSLLFIAIARWFWKRYDRPSKEAIEWQRQQEEKRKEQEVWESVEMQMRREAVEAEQKAAFQLKREVAAASGKGPDARAVAKAFESLGSASKPIDDIETNAMENIPDLVEVRQDHWDDAEESEPQEPDWELVERLKRIAESEETEETPHPELPSAPTLPEFSEEE